MKLQVPDFSTARVLVAGDLMLDRYWHGPTSRISPEAPVPVVKVESSEERPGGAGNVALNLAALGVSCSLVGVTGEDEAAGLLQKRLQNHQVNCCFIPLPDFTTITKLRVISRHQQLIRLDFEDHDYVVKPSVLNDVFGQHLAQHDVILLSDYAKGTLAQVQPLIEQCREKNKKVIIDPKGSDFSKYKGAYLLTPNMSEFEAVAGSCRSDQELEEKAHNLRRELQLDALLVTRSEQGMSLFDALGHHHFPTQAKDVFDVTGAGDTVIGVIAAGLAAGMPLMEAVALSNIAAGIVIAKLGTASVSVNELKTALRQLHDIEQGIVSEDRLVELVADARLHGEKVIMTNGCFDILHAGHVTYLEQAKCLGNRLVVAVNDDASIKRLKGEERPVNTMSRRMQVIAGLQCVDWVVGFYEDTPDRLICRVQPDVLVKGGDNDPDKIPGGECVRQQGGTVQVMDYVDNCSTTGLIRTIRQGETPSS